MRIPFNLRGFRRRRKIRNRTAESQSATAKNPIVGECRLFGLKDGTVSVRTTIGGVPGLSEGGHDTDGVVVIAGAPLHVG